MSDLFQTLKTEFRDEDFRYAYAESFLNTKIAAQIKTLREQREKTQAEIAAKMGIKQPGYRRFEDVNHSVWKTDSLWAIARALGVRLNISFDTFGTLPDEKNKLNKEVLRRPDFKDDPAFKEETEPNLVAAETPPRKVALGGLGSSPEDRAAFERWSNTAYQSLSTYLDRYAGKQGGLVNPYESSDSSFAMAVKRPTRPKGNLLEMPKRSEVTHLKRRHYARREQRIEQRPTHSLATG